MFSLSQEIKGVWNFALLLDKKYSDVCLQRLPKIQFGFGKEWTKNRDYNFE